MDDAPSPPPAIWVVVLNYNGREDSLRCLESLRPTVARGVSIVLVDNASDEPLPDDLGARFPTVHVLRNARNEGYAGGNNRGIELALSHGAEWVVLLNNDTIVDGAFAEMCQAAAVAAAAEGVGIWGPLIYHMDEPDVLMTEGVIFNRPGVPGFFERQPIAPDPGARIRFIETDIVNGCCLAAARDVFERIGLIDERLFLVHEESDLCLRAREAGFRCAVVPRAVVWHKGSSAFARTGKRLQRYFDARNLWYLIRRRPSASARGRTRRRSTTVLLRHLYHRYCEEMDHGQPVAATAVVEGLHDALLGRHGPYAAQPRPAARVLGAAFSAVRRLNVTLGRR